MIIPLHESENKVASPDDVNKILQAVLKTESEEDRDKEHFWVLMLDTRNRIKSLDLVSLGTLNQALVHPRDVFRRAITQGCASILLAHNHPSGETSPSDEDTSITERMKNAGDILGIAVLDHIIIGSDQFYSFKQEGFF